MAWKGVLWFLAVCVLAFLASGPARAGDLIVLQDYGVLCPGDRSTGKTVPAPLTGAGHMNRIRSERRFDMETTLVPHVHQLSFGVIVRQSGRVPMQVGMLHVRRPDGRLERMELELGKTARTLRAFRFRDMKDTDLGTWKWSVVVDGRVQFEQTFTVVPPSGAPDVLDACFSKPVS